MNNLNLTLKGPSEIALVLADRIRALRLLRGWTQATLASRAGVTTASYRRMETSGKASLELILKVAYALYRLEEFEQLFQPPAARTIEELEKQTTRPTRRRGSI